MSGQEGEGLWCLHHIFGGAEKENTPLSQALMEGQQDLALSSGLKVDQKIAATDQVQIVKARGRGENIVVQEPDRAAEPFVELASPGGREKKTMAKKRRNILKGLGRIDRFCGGLQSAAVYVAGNDPKSEIEVFLIKKILKENRQGDRLLSRGSTGNPDPKGGALFFEGDDRREEILAKSDKGGAIAKKSGHPNQGFVKKERRFSVQSGFKVGDVIERGRESKGRGAVLNRSSEGSPAIKSVVATCGGTEEGKYLLLEPVCRLRGRVHG